MNGLVIFGIAAPQIVVVIIEILKKVGLVNTGDQARIANIIVSNLVSMAAALISEFEIEPTNFVLIVITALWSMVIAALEYNVGERAVLKIRK